MYLKKLNKPINAVILAGLLLFTSCNSNSDFSAEDDSTLSTEQYVENQVILIENLIDFFSNEDSQNLIKLDAVEEIGSLEELEVFLEESEISNPNYVVGLLQNVIENNNKLIQSNPNIDLEIIDEMITSKMSLDSNIEAKEKLFIESSAGPTCESQYQDAKNGCAIAAGVGLASSIIAGFFTLGTGTAVGLVATTLGMAACFGRAGLQYDCCRDPANLNCS